MGYRVMKSIGYRARGDSVKGYMSNSGYDVQGW